MSKHKKDTRREETGKAKTKKKQFLKVGISQKNENHKSKCERSNIMIRKSGKNYLQYYFRNS